jgi:hypothetical protein
METTFLQELFHQLFGSEATPANVTAAIIYFLVGVAFIQAAKVAKGVATNPDTPAKFNFWYYISSNAGRIIGTLSLGLMITFGGASLLSLFGVQVPEVAGKYVPLAAGLFSDYIRGKIESFIESKK